MRSPPRAYARARVQPRTRRRVPMPVAPSAWLVPDPDRVKAENADERG